MMGGVTRLSELPGLPGRVTPSAGVTIRHVNVANCIVIACKRVLFFDHG